MPSYKQDEPKKAGTFFVEPGIYRVEIEKATETTSKTSGNPMIKLDCRVLLDEDAKGPIVWDHLVFTPKAAWKIDQFLASIGQAVVPGEEVEVEALDLVGQTGIVLLGEEPGQKDPNHRFNTLERWIFGDERAQWLRKATLPVSMGPVKKKEPDDIPF